MHENNSWSKASTTWRCASGQPEQEGENGQNPDLPPVIAEDTAVDVVPTNVGEPKTPPVRNGSRGRWLHTR